MVLFIMKFRWKIFNAMIRNIVYLRRFQSWSYLGAISLLYVGTATWSVSRILRSLWTKPALHSNFVLCISEYHAELAIPRRIQGPSGP